MKKVFFDTNVVLDLLIGRQVWSRPASDVFDLAVDEKIELYCSTLTLATASYYLEREHLSRDEIFSKLTCFIEYCMLTNVDITVAKSALNSSLKDFEDAMQYYSALAEGCDVIITRNKKDFSEAQIDVKDPQEFLDKFYNEVE